MLKMVKIVKNDYLGPYHEIKVLQISEIRSVVLGIGQEFTIDNQSLNRLIIDSTIENYGPSMCILMAEFLFISEVFNRLDPTIGYSN